MKNSWLNTKGETLAETIIALSVLAIGVTVASTVILNSMRNLSTAKNRVIAVNIAREGIEAVRSIRDTNWLFYSDRRRQCWNHDPAAGTCDGLSPIPPGTYITYKHSDQSWRLQLAEDTTVDGPDADLLTDNDLELAALSLVDIDLGTDSDGKDPDESGDGDTDDTDMYNHMYAGPMPVDSPFGTLVKPTIFKRYVVIEYLVNQPALPFPDDSIDTDAEWSSMVTAGTESALNRMRVTSVVEWKHGATTHTSELKSILTDHLGREELNT